MDVPKSQWLHNVLVAVDQLFNALLGGYADETLSSRCYRLQLDGVAAWPARLVDGLFFWQAHHCRTAYESEEKRRHFPPDLRGR